MTINDSRPDYGFRTRIPTCKDSDDATAPYGVAEWLLVPPHLWASEVEAEYTVAYLGGKSRGNDKYTPLIIGSGGGVEREVRSGGTFPLNFLADSIPCNSWMILNEGKHACLYFVTHVNTFIRSE